MNSSRLALVLLAALPPLANAAAALAIVNTERGYQYYWDGNTATVREAEDRVLTACARNAYVEKHTERCRVVLSGEGPAYYAVVRGSNGVIGYGRDEVEWGAVSQAHDNCARLDNCPTTAEGLWFDRLPQTRVMNPYELRQWEMEQERLRRERLREKEHKSVQ